MQLIDVRDLGAWLVSLAEERVGGTFNAVTPPLAMEVLLETTRTTVNPDARLVWVAADFLLERGVGQWMELPLWVVDAEIAGMLEADPSRAVAAGLTFRPLEDTIAATLRDARLKTDAGLRPEREAELLAAWASLASGA